MKAIKIFLVIIVSLIPSFLMAVETETVGGTSYNWYETTWDKDKIFTQAGLLDQVGITLDNFKIAENIGDINLETIDGSYGGVLLWASHGIYDQGCYCMITESFENENGAINRYNYLVNYTGFSSDRIVKAYNYNTGHWAIGLTDAGIAYLFGGSNAIVLVASCYGGLVGGEWGGRVKVSYNGTVDYTVAKTQMADLIKNLTGYNSSGVYKDFSKMTVTKAVQDGQVISGIGDTALIPWVSSYQPDQDALGDDSRTVTVSFGVKMEQSGNPFEVTSTGGLTVDRNEWLDAGTADAEISGATGGDKITFTLNDAQIKSSKNVYLPQTWTKIFTYSDNPAATLDGFYVYDGTAHWRVSSEYETAGYRVEGAASYDSPWSVVATDTDGAGNHSVGISSGPHSTFRLVEIENGGKEIVHRVAREGYNNNEPEYNSPTAADLKEKLALLAKERDISLNLGKGEKYVIFTVDSLKSVVESYVADYWEGIGYTVYLRTVDNYPSDPDSFRAALKDTIAQLASEGAVYFHLIGDANDWQQFEQEWPGSWEQIRQGYLSCGYPENGQPEKDLIPTWAFMDTLSRNHSTPWFVPYYLTDKPYSDTDDDGVPDVVFTRWPVTQQWEVLALALKMQEYMQGYEPISSSYISKIINCVGDLAHDGQSDGVLASVFADTVTAEIPPGHYQSWIYESDYYYDCDRNIEVAARWNSVAPNLVFIISSYSKRVWPGNFFDQTNVITPFHMGMINEGTPFATVLAMSCDAADFARTEDPEYGLPIFHRFLVEEDKGAIAWIGPMLGSWQDGNKVIAKYFVQEIYSNLSRPVAESYLAAMQRVYTDFAGCKTILQTADLYTFLGHPLLTFRRRPVVTATGDEEIPVASSLAQNYPNPFNPVTTIRFSSSHKGHVELLIYDVKGRRVSVLVDKEMPSGRHSISWNGKNDSGKSVASGLYFYRLKAGEKVITHKMILLK